MDTKEIISLLELVEYYSCSKRKLEAQLPYHLNVIDELYINENGHSRILTKLLQYKTEDMRYEMLESLLECILKNFRIESFGCIKVDNPEITQEKERIDLWVREQGKYAIIFENKIYNAADQDAQLSRYIEKTKEYGFSNDQIYVVYLSHNGDGPDEQSWGVYKDDFQSRYVNLSFKDHILKWLKDKVYPNIRIKETILRSGIEQYIDYLEGLFNSRTQYNAIKMETEKTIIDQLQLEKQTDLEKIRLLKDKIVEVNELYNQLVIIKEKYREKALTPYKQRWNHEIAQLYPGYGNSKEGGHVGRLVLFKGDFVNVRISEDDDRQMYCQIDKYGHENKELSAELMSVVNGLLPQHTGNICVWKYFDINDFDGVFNCFKEVMDLLIKG